jgi:hypothetical protein
MSTLQVKQLRGLLFDEEGRSRSHATQSLAVTVTSLKVGWVICVSAKFSNAYVSILVTRQDLTAEIIDDLDNDVPLFATGLLYSDEADAHIVDGDPVRRSPIVLAGSFEGACLLPCGDDASGYKLRVDCAALLPFWIECDFELVDGQ